MAHGRGRELLTHIIPIGLLIILICFLSRIVQQRVFVQSQGMNRIAKPERDKCQMLAQPSARYSNITLWVITPAVIYSLFAVRTYSWASSVPIVIRILLDVLVVDLLLVMTWLILSPMLPTKVKGKKEIERANEDEQKEKQEQCQQTLKAQAPQQQQDFGQSRQGDATTQAPSKNTEIIEKLNTIQKMLAELAVDMKDSARQHAQQRCGIKGGTHIQMAPCEDMTDHVVSKMQRERPKSGNNSQKARKILELKPAIKGRRKMSLEELKIVKNVHFEENQKPMPWIPSFISTHNVDAGAVPDEYWSATRPIRDAEFKDNLQGANCVRGSLAASIPQPISDVSSTDNQLALKANRSKSETYAGIITDQDPPTTQSKRGTPSMGTWQDARVHADDVKRDLVDFNQAVAHRYPHTMLRRRQKTMTRNGTPQNMLNDGQQHSQEHTTLMHEQQHARLAQQAVLHQPQHGHQNQTEQHAEEQQRQLYNQRSYCQLMQTNEVYNEPFQKSSELFKQEMTQFVQHSGRYRSRIPKQQVDLLKMSVKKMAIREVRLLTMEHQEQQQRKRQQQLVDASGPVSGGQNSAVTKQMHARQQEFNMYNCQLQLQQMQLAMSVQPPNVSSPTGISPSLPVAHEEIKTSAKHPLGYYMKELARIDEQNKERLSKAHQGQDKASEKSMQMSAGPAVMDLLSSPTRSNSPISGNEDTKSSADSDRIGMSTQDVVGQSALRSFSSEELLRNWKQMTDSTSTTHLQKMDEAQGEHDTISGVNQLSVLSTGVANHDRETLITSSPPVAKQEPKSSVHGRLDEHKRQCGKLRRTMAPVRPMWLPREAITRAERLWIPQTSAAASEVCDAEEDSDSLSELNSVSSTNSLPDLLSVDSTEERPARRGPRLDLSALIQDVGDMTAAEVEVPKEDCDNANEGDSIDETKTKSTESKTTFVGAQPNCEPYVSYNEKCYITHAITQLDDRGNQEALEIVRKNMPNLINDADQIDIELDIDDLPNTVLLKLLTLVKTLPQSWPTPPSASTAASRPDMESKPASLSPGFWTSDPMPREPLERSQVEANGAMQKTGAATGRNHPLTDYQRQLTRLKEQHKKRLMMARQEQDQSSREQEGASGADEDGFVMVAREDETNNDDAYVTVENDPTSSEALGRIDPAERIVSVQSRGSGGLISSRPTKGDIKAAYELEAQP